MLTPNALRPTEAEAAEILAQFARDMPRLKEAMRVWATDAMKTLAPAFARVIDVLADTVREIKRKADAGDEECQQFMRELAAEAFGDDDNEDSYPTKKGSSAGGAAR